MTPGAGPLPAALVLSLDFELHWGVRDRLAADGPFSARLLGARAAIPSLLDLFAEFEVAATWATVGFLFAGTRAELERFRPSVRPRYRDPALCPYGEPVGEGEADDPLHYAASLVESIRRSPRQEVATHTFSHYFCHDEGRDRAAFRADLRAAVEIAAHRGLRLRSIVFPRNQHAPEFDDLLLEQGITAYRGNPLSWMWRFDGSDQAASRLRRAGRFLDVYADFTGHNAVAWSEVLQPGGLADVRASVRLRAYSRRLRHLEPLRLARIRKALHAAARERRIFHLWWHPHNFGAYTQENLGFLRAVLEEFRVCRERYGMLSLSMAGVDAAARTAHAAPSPAREAPTAAGAP